MVNDTIFIAGPCVIENMDVLETVASELVRLQKKYDIEIYFKSSFDKANRTSISSFRGPGMEKGLQMLSDIKSKFGLKLLTDIHESYQAEPALHILQQWREKREGCRYVFNLVKETLDLDDAEALYKARNNATKCINQSLAVVGEQIGLPFSLSMHAARHSFAVFALNKGLSMSVVSRLLGHSSTDITEKVYARFLPETLSAEVAKLSGELINLTI